MLNSFEASMLMIVLDRVQGLSSQRSLYWLKVSSKINTAGVSRNSSHDGLAHTRGRRNQQSFHGR